MSTSFLSELPIGWRKLPLKHACDINPEVLPETTPGDTEIEYLDIGAVDGGANELLPTTLRFDSAPSRARRIVKSGDTILSTVRTYLKAVATFPTVESNLVASTGFAVARPNGRLHPKFAYWAMLSEPFVESVVAHSEGVSYPAINPSVLGNLEIVVPPRPLQENIANFLDQQTARIDALIAAKVKLKDGLNEFRKSLITEAVTKGLNASCDVKPSGLSWLGDVPAHWPMKRLKHLGIAIIGLTYSPADVVDEQAGTLVLRSSNVQQGQIALGDNVFVQGEIPEKLRTQVGDILICSRNGSRALIGKNAVIAAEHAGHSFGAFMTVFRSEYNEYLRWVLASHIFEYHSASFLTSTINQLTTGNLYSLELPFPPAAERTAIVSYLANRVEQVDELVLHVWAHISRLREYRSSLISAAVTGQLDINSYKEAA